MEKKKKAEYFQYPAGLMDDERVVALCLKMGSNDPFAVLVYLLDTMTRRDDFEIVYDDSTKGALAWKFRVSEETLETIVDHLVDADILQLNDNRLGCDFLKESLTRLVNYREKQAEYCRKGLAKRWGKKTDTQADGATNATETSIKEDKRLISTLSRPYKDLITKKSIVENINILSREKKVSKEKKPESVKSTPCGAPTETTEIEKSESSSLNTEEKAKITLPTPQPPSPRKDTVQDCETRRELFRLSLDEYRAEYGDATVDAFFDYWSERTKDGRRMRWEREQTWETRLRIKAWKRRDDTTHNTNSYGYDARRMANEQRKAESLASIKDKLRGAGIVEGAGVIR